MKTIDSYQFITAAKNRFGYDVEEYENYSGRYMYGKEARSAITTQYSPNSSEGKRFLKDTGALVDNMGKDYIYYIR